jgi:hypothetical protein
VIIAAIVGVVVFCRRLRKQEVDGPIAESDETEAMLDSRMDD